MLPADLIQLRKTSDISDVLARRDEPIGRLSLARRTNNKNQQQCQHINTALAAASPSSSIATSSISDKH